MESMSLTKKQLLSKITLKNIKISEFQGKTKKQLGALSKPDLVRIYNNQKSLEKQKNHMNASVLTKVTKQNLKKLDKNMEREILRVHFTNLRNKHLTALALYMNMQHKVCKYTFPGCKTPKIKEAYESIPYFKYETQYEQDRSYRRFKNILIDNDSTYYRYYVNGMYLRSVYSTLTQIKNKLIELRFKK